jgi:hypothetical protein
MQSCVKEDKIEATDGHFDSVMLMYEMILASFEIAVVLIVYDFCRCQEKFK